MEFSDELTRLGVSPGALAAFCRQNGIRELSLFGSVLRRDFTESSDVDVLVEFESPRSLLEHVRIQRELSELLGRRVDLVTKRALKGRIGREILSSRKVVYAKA